MVIYRIPLSTQSWHKSHRASVCVLMGYALDKKKTPRKDVSVSYGNKIPRLTAFARNDSMGMTYQDYLLSAVATSTAQATLIASLV